MRRQYCTVWVFIADPLPLLSPTGERSTRSLDLRGQCDHGSSWTATPLSLPAGSGQPAPPLLLRLRARSGPARGTALLQIYIYAGSATWDLSGIVHRSAASLAAGRVPELQRQAQGRRQTELLE